MANKVKEMLESAVANIKTTFDANSIIGSPITADDGTIIVPVTRVSYGFGGGGGDFAAKNTNNSEGTFAGGLGGGATVKADAFLVINGGNVRLITMDNGSSPADRILDMVPGILSKANEAIQNRKAKKEEENGEIIDDYNEG